MDKPQDIEKIKKKLKKQFEEMLDEEESDIPIHEKRTRDQEFREA